MGHHFYTVSLYVVASAYVTVDAPMFITNFQDGVNSMEMTISLTPNAAFTPNTNRASGAGDFNVKTRLRASGGLAARMRRLARRGRREFASFARLVHANDAN